MNKGLKILVGTVAFLGLLSVIFLITSKKKAATTLPATNVQVQKQPSSQVATTQPAVTQNVSAAKTALPTTISPQQRKANVSGQWNQCKNKTMDASKNLFWSVQITEAIPAGGTYAKGNLENDGNYPVHVIIKSDSQISDKIKQQLIVGKVAFLRGNCTDVASDGNVILQVF